MSTVNERQTTSDSSPRATPKRPPPHSGRAGSLLKALLWVVGATGALTLAAALTVLVGAIMAYPRLPDVTKLLDYRPTLPLRVFAADGELIGEFGEERRNLVRFEDIPPLMTHAVLAIEDARFFEHGGVDYRGVARAVIANLRQARSQGASTITMQVARNIFLSNEKTYLRKFYEILLTFKLEHLLTKEQILEIYMNQIFLGHRSFGFAAAAQTYFGKSMHELSIAEAAMLAGLPKAPSAFNPISNPRRARIRQLHIIDRMLENGFITQEQAYAARAEPLQLRQVKPEQFLRADYVGEMARQAVVTRFGQQAYTLGLQVHTTVDARAQRAAFRAVQQGVLDFGRRQPYRGPERFIDLPSDSLALEAAVDAAIASADEHNGMLSAVVLEATPRKVLVSRGDGEPIAITGAGLDSVRTGLAANAPPHLKIRPGAMVRKARGADQRWYLTQTPLVEAAFVAVDPATGAIRALVGGFDFNRNQFNRVTQSQRQPGSSFKPFIYSAALERGIMPATLVNDAPLFFSAAVTGSSPWEPRNFDGQFDGPMTVRTAMARSKNMASINLLKAVGPSSAQQWVTRFGFEAENHPPFLTMALGAGAVTPLQMASAFGVFANGGHYVAPVLITRVTDHRGQVLMEHKLQPPSESQRVISARNAFVMNQMLNENTRSGTAARAQSVLRRPDLYGKTGTTNNAVDAWFAGFHPTVSAAAWMGYDNPRNLGRQATGAALALPMWLQFMEEALRDVAVHTLSAPAGVIFTDGEWYFEGYGPGEGVAALGMADSDATTYDAQVGAPMAPVERNRILNLFRD